MADWTLKLRGGSFHGIEATWPKAEPVLIAWRCGGLDCAGHFTMNPEADMINLETAVAYKRTERDDETRVAIYEIGEDTPGPAIEREERELVPAGATPFDEPPPWETERQPDWAPDRQDKPSFPW